MPGEHTRTIDFTITNVGNNPANIWKMIGGFVETTGLLTEPECVALSGVWTQTTYSPSDGACTATDVNDISN